MPNRNRTLPYVSKTPTSFLQRLQMQALFFRKMGNDRGMVIQATRGDRQNVKRPMSLTRKWKSRTRKKLPKRMTPVRCATSESNSVVCFTAFLEKPRSQPACPLRFSSPHRDYYVQTYHKKLQTMYSQCYSNSTNLFNSCMAF